MIAVLTLYTSNHVMLKRAINNLTHWRWRMKSRIIILATLATIGIGVYAGRIPSLKNGEPGNTSRSKINASFDHLYNVEVDTLTNATVIATNSVNITSNTVYMATVVESTDAWTLSSSNQIVELTALLEIANDGLIPTSTANMEAYVDNRFLYVQQTGDISMGSYTNSN